MMNSLFILLYIKLIGVASFPDIINTQADFSNNIYRGYISTEDLERTSRMFSDNSIVFINQNKLAGFNFIHGLRLYNVSEAISNSNFMDCLDRCQANKLTCISFSYSKQKLECQLYDHDRFDEDDNFPINENESTRSDWLHYRFKQIKQLQSLILTAK